MENVVIVGSGIVGITAALLLKKKNVKNVYLIERAETCGGLLKSINNEDGVSFDMGTHIPNQTLYKEIDELLFSDMDSEDWLQFSYLKTGNFFAGNLYEESQFIYTPFLPKDIYLRGLIDLLNSNGNINKENYVNLLDFCNDYYGETYTEHIYKPLMKKLIGKNLCELHPKALDVFSFSRLIPGDKEFASNLKKSTLYDQKLAYATFLEGISPQVKYYPKKGGVGLWIKNLVEKLENSGVEIFNNTSLTNLEITNNKISKIQLDTGKNIDIDLLIWTVSPSLLLKTVNHTLNSKAPEFRSMAIFNFIFDKPFKSNNHYINCADGNYKSFRITLYPNINADDIQRAPYNCTVEVLTATNTDLPELNKIVIAELKEMGIVDDGAIVLYENFFTIENGFPILTPSTVESLKNQVEVVNSKFNNIILTGKATGESFYMSDSIIDTYNKINMYL